MQAKKNAARSWSISKRAFVCDAHCDAICNTSCMDHAMGKKLFAYKIEQEVVCSLPLAGWWCMCDCCLANESCDFTHNSIEFCIPCHSRAYIPATAPAHNRDCEIKF